MEAAGQEHTWQCRDGDSWREDACCEAPSDWMQGGALIRHGHCRMDRCNETFSNHLHKFISLADSILPPILYGAEP
eukprot:4099124-Pyramimonas_sp.AAC.1